jgi:hypothetical protein
MRDHNTGQQWDKRNLNDLSYAVIRVSCRGCRHSNLRYPIDLKQYQDPNWAWTLMIPASALLGLRRAQCRC